VQQHVHLFWALAIHDSRVYIYVNVYINTFTHDSTLFYPHEHIHTYTHTNTTHAVGNPIAQQHVHLLRALAIRDSQLPRLVSLVRKWAFSRGLLRILPSFGWTLLCIRTFFLKPLFVGGHPAPLLGRRVHLKVIETCQMEFHLTCFNHLCRLAARCFVSIRFQPPFLEGAP